MLFVAVPGTAADGHAYVPEALAAGAAAVATERHVPLPAGIAAVAVPCARRALATFAARFYGEPARALRLIGFTGTFGKTSTSAIVKQLLQAGGSRAGLLGSLGASYGHFHDPGNGLTTPAPVELQRALRELAGAGAEAVVMEVTSHALRTERVFGLQFAGGLLSAIQSGEHTDFHGTFEEYVAAKRLFVDYLAPDATLAFDADNAPARDLASAARVGRTIGFSIEGSPAADVLFREVALDFEGARFVVDGPAVHAPLRLRSPLLGPGHLRNVALALTYALGAGISLDVAGEVLTASKALPRRMERYDAAGRTVLDDTAGHPDSFAATFQVAGLLRRAGMTVVYALRGNRGVDINRRNAVALAALCAGHRADRLLITAAVDATSPLDEVTNEEAEAARGALDAAGCPYAWHNTLFGAIRDAIGCTGPGDLIVLTGAQGMNGGRRMIQAYS
jgi:UDP-N-acetylmuramoyl-L-alanyl-D-glutamate--2,6-diaminopimelate ligase